MQIIMFKWNNTVHTGVITNQEPNTILGLKTVIKVTHIDNQLLDEKVKFEMTIFGKCAVGYCGPFNVISIKKTSDPLN